MKNIDLCNILGMEENEVFLINGNNYEYKIIDNVLMYGDRDAWFKSMHPINKAVEELSKCPVRKIKYFTEKELSYMKLIDKKWKWIAKNKDGVVYIYKEKPYKDCYEWWRGGGESYQINDNYYLVGFIKLDFDEISAEDDEPVYIDDYVTRD